MKPVPLIFAGDHDPHAAAVVRALAARGVESVHVDRSGMVDIALSIDPVRSVIGRIDLARITSVWNRRFPPLHLPDEMERKWRKWCEQEFTEALVGMLLRQTVHWVSHPTNLRQASHKVLQLHVANVVGGLAVPDYLVTSNPDEAREFVWDLCKGDAVIKALGRAIIEDDTWAGTLFTSPASEIQGFEWPRVRFAPSIFQRRIRPRAEVRVTAVGDALFGVEIDVSGVSEIDYRRVDPYTLRHTPITLPKRVAKGCRAMLRHFGLRFGAFDFLLDDKGAFYFLELNPNGQWLWIQDMTGLPIAEAMAQELCRSLPSGSQRESAMTASHAPWTS
jgi:hypothetical protein